MVHYFEAHRTAASDADISSFSVNSIAPVRLGPLPQGGPEQLISAKMEISRLNRMVDVLMRQIEDKERFARLHGINVVPRGQAPQQRQPPPSHRRRPNRPMIPPPPAPASRLSQYAEFQQSQPTPLDGAKALLSLFNSPISTNPNGRVLYDFPPSRTPRQQQPRPQPLPQSGVLLHGEPERAPLSRPTIAAPGPTDADLPALRLAIPSSPYPQRSTRPSSRNGRSATPRPSQPHRKAPLDGVPRSGSPSNFERPRPPAPAASRQLAPLNRQGPFTPPMLFFCSFPPEDEQEQRERTKYEKEAFTPMRRHESREAHEQRFDAALGEWQRWRGGPPAEERPPGSEQSPRPRSRGVDNATSTGLSETLVQGAMRGGGGDAMLGAGPVPSPVDQPSAPTPIKERAGSRLGVQVTCDEELVESQEMQPNQMDTEEHQEKGAESPLSSGDASGVADDNAGEAMDQS